MAEGRGHFMASRGQKKRQGSDNGDLRNSPNFHAVLFVLFSGMLNPKNVPWLAVVVITFLLPGDDRQVIVLEFLHKNGLITVILLAVVVIMSVVWYLTRQQDRIEIQRISQERDALQRKLGSSTRSSDQ
jgi:threonine/homoserine/homoserine lactone efflux protein